MPCQLLLPLPFLLPFLFLLHLLLLSSHSCSNSGTVACMHVDEGLRVSEHAISFASSSAVSEMLSPRRGRSRLHGFWITTFRPHLNRIPRGAWLFLQVRRPQKRVILLPPSSRLRQLDVAPDYRRSKLFPCFVLAPLPRGGLSEQGSERAGVFGHPSAYSIHSRKA